MATANPYAGHVRFLFLLTSVSLILTQTAHGAPAQVNFSGPVVFPNTSTLEIELGGSPAPANAGVTFDQLVFTGVAATATIDGAKLKIILLPNPTLNQPYRVIKTQSGGSVNIASFFDGLINHIEHTRPDGVKYVVDADSTGVDVTFTNVPEPASTLFVLGCLHLIRRRAKHARG